jgi:hypothetical protein
VLNSGRLAKNTLAYYEHLQIREEKRFITLALGENGIKHNIKLISARLPSIVSKQPKLKFKLTS